MFSRAIIGASHKDAPLNKNGTKSKSLAKATGGVRQPILPRKLLKDEARNLEMGEEERKAQLERNQIMPERFEDENDENRNIQQIKINKPDFDVKQEPQLSLPTANKTLTTHGGDIGSFDNPLNNGSKRGSHPKLTQKNLSNRVALKEPNSPTDSKLNLPQQQRKNQIDFKNNATHIEGFKSQYQ